MIVRLAFDGKLPVNVCVKRAQALSENEIDPAKRSGNATFLYRGAPRYRRGNYDELRVVKRSACARYPAINHESRRLVRERAAFNSRGGNARATPRAIYYRGRIDATTWRRRRAARARFARQ